MREHDIIVSVYQIRRKSAEWTMHCPKMDYAITAGVSSMSSRIERSEFFILESLDDPRWEIDGGEHSRKMVRIELPDSIHVGEYVVGNTTVLDGPYGEYTARDGNGKTVYIFCKKSFVGFPGEEDRVIDSAVNSGMMASIPTEAGGREEIQLNVVAVSELYSGVVPPSNWDPVREDIPLPKLKKLRIRKGLTAAKLAVISGVNIRQIQRVELGESEAGNLTAKNILALASALGVNPKDLI